MKEEALIEAIADKTAKQVTKMPGSFNGLIIETASPLVLGQTRFVHKVVEVNSSNFINKKYDLITKVGKEETKKWNHTEFQREFLVADSYSFVRFSEMEMIEFIQKM